MARRRAKASICISEPSERLSEKALQNGQLKWMKGENDDGHLVNEEDTGPRVAIEKGIEGREGVCEGESLSLRPEG